MKLQKIVSRLQELHPKEIDLSLDRIQNLCKKLGNPQDKIKAITIVGTNGKYSTIQAMFSILKEANLKCNIYTSPHIKCINERFVFNNEELNDGDLANLLEEIENANNGEPITFFEILTAAYFCKASQYPDNINLIESGLFFRFDATNILKNNLASVVTSIGLDHLDWLPESEQTVEKIIFEKTSSLLNSNIIVAKQSTNQITDHIKKTISNNKSNKVFHNENYSFISQENDFFYYEDKLGGIKLPMPNVKGQFQLENVSTAIATLKTLKDLNIKDDYIKKEGSSILLPWDHSDATLVQEGMKISRQRSKGSAERLKMDPKTKKMNPMYKLDSDPKPIRMPIGNLNDMVLGPSKQAIMEYEKEVMRLKLLYMLKENKKAISPIIATNRFPRSTMTSSGKREFKVLRIELCTDI